MGFVVSGYQFAYMINLYPTVAADRYDTYRNLFWMGVAAGPMDLFATWGEPFFFDGFLIPGGKAFNHAKKIQEHARETEKHLQLPGGATRRAVFFWTYVACACTLGKCHTHRLRRF
jgi:hypothetical protein